MANITEQKTLLNNFYTPRLVSEPSQSKVISRKKKTPYTYNTKLLPYNSTSPFSTSYEDINNSQSCICLLRTQHQTRRYLFFIWTVIDLYIQPNLFLDSFLLAIYFKDIWKKYNGYRSVSLGLPCIFWQRRKWGSWRDFIVIIVKYFYTNDDVNASRTCRGYSNFLKWSISGLGRYFNIL